ncbi:hypothetical protein JHK85_055945 [Glycine max]|nr:hypothetical protein JHK85_055945 [Glycine max]
MLPSTFQDKMKEQEALKRRLNARIQYAKFVQHTIKEMAKEIQNSQNGEMKKTAEDLDEFMNKEWDTQDASQIATEVCGFVTILSGTFLLHKTKDMGNRPIESPVFGNDIATREEDEDSVVESPVCHDETSMADCHNNDLEAYNEYAAGETCATNETVDCTNRNIDDDSKYDPVEMHASRGFWNCFTYSKYCFHSQWHFEPVSNYWNRI